MDFELPKEIRDESSSAFELPKHVRDGSVEAPATPPDEVFAAIDKLGPDANKPLTARQVWAGDEAAAKSLQASEGFSIPDHMLDDEGRLERGKQYLTALSDPNHPELTYPQAKLAADARIAQRNEPTDFAAMGAGALGAVPAWVGGLAKSAHEVDTNLKLYALGKFMGAGNWLPHEATPQGMAESAASGAGRTARDFFIDGYKLLAGQNNWNDAKAVSEGKMPKDEYYKRFYARYLADRNLRQIPDATAPNSVQDMVGDPALATAYSPGAGHLASEAMNFELFGAVSRPLTMAAQAAKMAAFNDALSAAASGGAQISAEAASPIIAGTSVAAGAVENGARAAQGIAQKVADTLPGGVVANAAAGVAGHAAGIPGVAPIAAGIAGLKAAPGTLEGAAKAAQGVRVVADAAKEAGGQATTLQRVAADVSNPPWLRRVANELAGPVQLATDYAAPAAGAVTKGAAINAALALPNDPTDEQLGSAMGMGAGFEIGLGGVGHAVRGKAEGRAQSDIVRFVANQQQLNGTGKALAALAKLDHRSAKFLATASQLMPVDVLTGDAFQAATGVSSPGAFGNGDRVLINVDSPTFKRDPMATIAHEFGHGLDKAALDKSPYRMEQFKQLFETVTTPEQRQQMRAEYARKMVSSIVAGENAKIDAANAQAHAENTAAAALPNTEGIPQPDPKPVMPRRVVDINRINQWMSEMDANHPGWDTKEFFAETSAHATGAEDLNRLRMGKKSTTAASGGVGDSIRQLKESLLQAAGLTEKTGKFINGEPTFNPEHRAIFDDPRLKQAVHDTLTEVYDPMGDTVAKNPKAEKTGKQFEGSISDVAKGPIFGWEPGKRVETDAFRVDEKGVVTPKEPREIRNTERQRARAMQTYAAATGQAGKDTSFSGEPPKAFWDALERGGFSPEIRGKVRFWADQLNNSGLRPLIRMWNYGIGTTLGSGKSWADSVKSSKGNLAAIEREVVPAGIKVSKAGNVLLDGWDTMVLSRKLADWQNSGKLSLWGNDTKAALGDAITYLQNHYNGQPGETGLGTAKRDVLNALIIGRGNNANRGRNAFRDLLAGAEKAGIYRSFRVDRTDNYRQFDNPGYFFDYTKQQGNLKPEGGKTNPSEKYYRSFWIDRSGNIVGHQSQEAHSDLAYKVLGHHEGESEHPEGVYGEMATNGWRRGVGYDGTVTLETNGEPITPAQRKKLIQMAEDRQGRATVDDWSRGEVELYNFNNPSLKPESNEVGKVADQYRKRFGTEAHTVAQPLDGVLGQRTADWFEQQQHNPNDPAVKAAYQALKQETLDQALALHNSGFKLEPWNQPGQPYQNSKEVAQDVAQNKHLYYFTGGDMAADHPLAEQIPADVAKTLGVPPTLTYNDIFRGVHDVFGHAEGGFEFGPKGEMNAFLAHNSMYSDAAKPALGMETHAQNSWVNFGSHLRDESGNVRKKGDPGYLSPTERPFAEQKAGILPPELAPKKQSEAQALLKPEITAGIDDDLTMRGMSIDDRPTMGANQMILRDHTGKGIAYVVYGVEKAKDGQTVGKIDYIHVPEENRGQNLSELLYRKLGQTLQAQGVTTLEGDVRSQIPFNQRKKVFGEPVSIAGRDGNAITEEQMRQQVRSGPMTPGATVAETGQATVRSHIDPDKQFKPAQHDTEDGKPLPHTAGGTIRVLHYTSRDLPGIRQPGDTTTLDPKFFGKGKANTADRRGGNKVYAFVEGSPMGGDAQFFSQLGAHGATISGNRIYDLTLGKEDPLGYYKNPNRWLADENLQEAGYAGVMVDTGSGDGRKVVMLFDPTEVTYLGKSKAETAQSPSDVPFKPEAPDTPEFNRWFGASHVRDADGNPLLLTHVTDKAFHKFIPGGKKPNQSGRAIWLGLPDGAVKNAHNGGGRTEGSRTIPLYAKIERPLILDSDTTEWAQSVYGKEFPYIISDDTLGSLKRDNYDGVIMYETGKLNTAGTDQIREVVVFDPSQVKSALGNSGAFDAKNPDIRFKAENPEEPKRKVTEQRARTILNTGRFSFLTGAQGDNRPGGADPAADFADTQKLKKQLELEGLDVYPANGYYLGSQEPALMVVRRSPGQADLVDLYGYQLNQTQTFHGDNGKYRAPYTQPREAGQQGTETFAKKKLKFLDTSKMFNPDGTLNPKAKLPDGFSVVELPGGDKVAFTAPDLYNQSRDAMVTAPAESLDMEHADSKLTPTGFAALRLARATLNGRVRMLDGSPIHEKVKRALEIGVPEVNEALTRDGDSGKDWYNKDIGDMDEVTAQLFPETKNPVQMDLFKALLAVLSDGQKVSYNYRYAAEAYMGYLMDGKIAVRSKFRQVEKEREGKAVMESAQYGRSSDKSLPRLQELIDTMGLEPAMKWLKGVDESGTPNALFFGPKLGRFFLNVQGMSGEVTVDLWMTRTWNRWMGTPLGTEGGEIVVKGVPMHETERAAIIQAVTQIAQATGLSPMQVQAVLWYYEKDLYAAQGVRTEREGFHSAAQNFQQKFAPAPGDIDRTSDTPGGTGPYRDFWGRPR